WPLNDAPGSASRELVGAGAPAITADRAMLRVRRDQLEAGPYFRSIGEAPGSNGYWQAMQDGIAIDFDNDGDLDIVGMSLADFTFGGINHQVSAFRNEGGRFVVATTEVLGTIRMEHPRHLLTLDANGDGR